MPAASCWACSARSTRSPRQNYGVDAELYTAELRLDGMLAARGATPVYTPLPRFPAVTRDVAIVCSADIPVAKLSACILAAGGQYLKGCELFDVYTGAPIPVGYKSVAFSLTLRADDQTLTDDHAEETMQERSEGAQGDFQRNHPLSSVGDLEYFKKYFRTFLKTVGKWTLQSCVFWYNEHKNFV